MTLRIAAAVCGILVIFCALTAFAQPPGANEMPSVIQVPEAARATTNFNAAAATDAYMAQIPADKTARSGRLFRRRLLADSLGFPLWRCRRAAVAEFALVGPHAGSGGDVSLASSHYIRSCTGCNISFSPASSFFRSRFTKTTSANTSTGSPRKPSARGWAIRSKVLAVNLVLGGVLVMVLFGIVAPSSAHLVDLGRGCDRSCF